MKSDNTAHPASYRDPAGFVFRSGAQWYRQINLSYAPHYDQLLSSGLCKTLTENGFLIPHQDIDANLTGSPLWYRTLLPLQLPFTGNPAEYCPAQLKDAALLTLQIMRIAMDHDMILKDAAPSNIQFIDGRPVLIDTLSFERYDPSLPWIAYRQFCESFLFPLYLHHYCITGTAPWLLAWPDGIPASTTARLLPFKSRFSLGVWLHVRLQSRIAERNPAAGPAPAFNRQKLLNLVTNLNDIVKNLETHTASPSSWNNYYASTILSQDYLLQKDQLFRSLITGISFDKALDLGANDGYFSKILAEHGALVLAVDSDWQCIDRLYQDIRLHRISNIIPLCADLANPTPAAGFHHTERASFTERCQTPLLSALALIHHLAIGRNIPLPRIAAWFASLTSSYLVIEFVPPDDEKAQALLLHKDALRLNYHADAFTAAFAEYFRTEKALPVPGTQRTLYLMKKID